MSKLYFFINAIFLTTSCASGGEVTWECPQYFSEIVYSSDSGKQYVITPNQEGWVTLEVPGEIASVDHDKYNLSEVRSELYIINDAILITPLLLNEGRDKIKHISCKKINKKNNYYSKLSSHFICSNSYLESITEFSFDARRGIVSMWATDEAPNDRMNLVSRYGLGLPC